ILKIMKIRVLLKADSAFTTTKYFFKQLTLNFLIRKPTFNFIKSRKLRISTNQGLQLAACSQFSPDSSGP
ncbi:MAG: hypothetical protein ACN4EP_08650, partial [Sediminibacterium sp.]